MARKRRRPLVVGAQSALDQLKADVMGTANAEQAKFESARRQNVPLTDGDNSQLTAKQAGQVGGPIGGQMVKKLIAMAQMQMMSEQQNTGPEKR